MTFHINDTVEKLGRKIISGDVIELPHLKDDFALNDLSYALKRFYVIEEVTRAAEGFSVTWYPHLYRAKCKPLVDSQEYKQILDGIANNDADKGTYNPNITYYPGDIVTGLDGKKYEVVQEVTGVVPSSTDPNYRPADSLRDVISTYNKEMEITQAVLNQAEADAPKSGYDTSKYWTVQREDDGTTSLISVDNDQINQYSADSDTATYLDEDGNQQPLYDEDGNPVAAINAASTFTSADGKGYVGYLTEDGVPPNGAPVTVGFAFPYNPVEGQFHLRTDYLPNRLFRYNGVRWIKFEDNVRMTMSNLGASDTGTGDIFQGKDVRLTQKTSFINNPTTTEIDGHTVKQKQILSKALRPQADE
jgi:hypothetical protein